ncbi:hypothetical protein A5699_02050 [Mycobacterium sp. E802]|uniref:hypothetical protein n=1 Tax=Mycobacterium sp. E802 TaxID=1834152 RepID=UPI0007FCF707|nr:hypothetical protein [Mycobacterium sp. E802]OBG87531.1 hypothetical protein A5699_02050 [Mycobacterium sp. E802]
MRYFTDGAGHYARVHTDAPFGPAFSSAQVQTYNAKRDRWVDAPGLTTELRFSGNWDPCEPVSAE